MTTAKTIALTRWTFVGKVMSLLLNMLSRLVITFLPRSEHLLISWLQSPSAVILEPQKIKSVTVSTVSPSIYSLSQYLLLKPISNLLLKFDVILCYSFIPWFMLLHGIYIHTYIHIHMITQSYLTLCIPMDCCLPGFSLHEILQVTTLEWEDILFSSESS